MKNYLLSVFLLVATLLFAQEKKENPFSFKWDNGFKLQSADKNFKLKFGGRIMVDHAFFSQNDDLDTTFGKLTAKSGTEFRRARFFFAGTLYQNVDYKLQIDFAKGEVVLKDAYLGVKNIPVVGNIRVGHVKEPFHLTSLSSSKYMTFMETGFPISFMQERNNGIVLFNDFLDKKLSLQAGYFRNENNNSSDKVANDGYAFTARVSTLAINNKEKKQLLHFGLAYSYRKPDSNEYKISSRPEAHLSSQKYISTETIDNVDNINLLNFETDFVTGPLSFQGEYLIAKVNTTNATVIDNYKFSSYYGQVSYFLTGESRKFKSSYTGFSRLKPLHNFGNAGAGAWEIALRYSNADLTNEDVIGGEQADITLGLNWYLNPSTRIMLNNVFADIKDKGKANIFQVRFQIDF